MRLIDADALIEKMKKVEADYEDAMTCPSWWTAYSVISEQPTAYDKDGWINVSERLPESAGWVLTCDKEGNIHIFFYANGYFCESFGCRKITEKHERFYVPIAWQPLPPAFKPKGE